MNLMSKDKNEIKKGFFHIKDFKKKYKNAEFYIYNYNKVDGEWIEKGEIICDIKIVDGEWRLLDILIASIIAPKSGIIEHILKKEVLLKNNDHIYTLYEKGLYYNENIIDKSIYKHYFFNYENYDYIFKRWLVDDGKYIKKGESIYEYHKNYEDIKIHKAEKDGYIDILNEDKISSLTKNELLYYIRDNDNQRIQRKYLNTPKFIYDEFENNKNILLEHTDYSSFGINIKSDDFTIDFSFTFNYLNNKDHIVFYFKSNQMKLKKNDMILFLFDNNKKINFIINKKLNNTIKHSDKYLEFSTIITEEELKLFRENKFKKGKILLKSQDKEYLFGDYGFKNFINVNKHINKSNLQIMIKKIAIDYHDIVIKNIENYKPLNIRNDNIEIKKYESVYVYLMIDTTNKFHKIGISNNPTYREKTLLGDRPTIELIISKKYSNRKIAKNIETSLHNIYSSKKIRGEWFNLNDEEIKEIKEILK